MNITTVLYDGECQFCKKWVHFAQSKLQDKTISFLPFNSEECIKIEQELEIYVDHKETKEKTGKSLELPYEVGIVGKVGNELGKTQ